MLNDLLRQPLCPWQASQGKYADVVLDSRVRLVRNVADCVFPHRASPEVLQGVIEQAKACIAGLDGIGHGTYTYTALADLSALQREQLVLHHLSTPAHIQQVAQRGLLWRHDGAAIVLCNEDDHFVIQTHAAGFNLRQVWDDAAQIDDALEQKINVAFRDDVGYVTASPSLTGTGLIAGVTIHIPAIVAMKRLNRIVQGITKFGFAIGSVYGERHETLGNLFQITNQITLGVSETDTLEQLQQIVLQIIQEERNCRAILWSHDQARWQNRACRAYGLLAYATQMSEAEALKLGSDLRLGLDMDVLDGNPIVHVALLQAVEPACLQDITTNSMSDEDMLAARAKAIHQLLEQYGVAVPPLS